ncbi:MAG: methyltransferase domain-containing protein [Pyrodictiaceae archaeon]
MLGQSLLRIIYRKPSGLRAHYRKIASIIEERRVILDSGGGSGGLYVALEEEPEYYILLDPDVKLASRMTRSCRSEAVVAVAENTPLRPLAVDATVLNDSLHHFNAPVIGLLEALRVTRKCIYIRDYVAKGLGRVIAFAEKLMGFPASFVELEILARILEERGFKVDMLRKDGIGYILRACRVDKK